MVLMTMPPCTRQRRDAPSRQATQHAQGLPVSDTRLPRRIADRRAPHLADNGSDPAVRDLHHLPCQPAEARARGQRRLRPGSAPPAPDPRAPQRRRGSETCPVSTEGGTRRVQLVREGGGGGGCGGADPSCCACRAGPSSKSSRPLINLPRPRSSAVSPLGSGGRAPPFVRRTHPRDPLPRLWRRPRMWARN
jgi:hypothetical protein